MYKQDHYNQVLKIVQDRYQIQSSDLPPNIWIAWRVQIKKMFDEGILISEINNAIPEAENKKQWPLDTSFWHRVHDVVLKNRYERRPVVKVDKGTESIADLLRKRMGVDNKD